MTDSLPSPSALYEASEEDLRYALGLINLEGSLLPAIQLYFEDWPREVLEAVREVFDQGMELQVRSQGHTLVIHLATRRRMSIATFQQKHLNQLRAPAWDATLGAVEPVAANLFEQGRRCASGFLLLMQTPEWEFSTFVALDHGHLEPGPVEPRRHPIPPP